MYEPFLPRQCTRGSLRSPRTFSPYIHPTYGTCSKASDGSVMRTTTYCGKLSGLSVHQ